MNIRPYGIRLHVALLTLIPLLVMAGSLGAFFLHDRFAQMDRDLLTRGQLIGRQLAASSEYGVFSNNRIFLSGVTKGALLEEDVKAVMLLNGAGKVIEAAGEVEPAASAWLATASQENRVIDNGRELLLYQTMLSTQIALEETEAAKAPQKIGAVVVALSWQRTQQLKARLLWLTVAATAIFLLITLYFVYLASRRIIAPIRELSRTVDAIGAGDLDSRVLLPSRVSELNTLGQGINRMAAELQQERAILQQRIDEATQQLRGLAFFDTLTLLPNRRLLMDRLGQMMAASKRSGSYGAVMFIDLDNFKPLNDKHGHEAGDALLVECAERLRGCIREMDTVGRFGGDEFVVMLSELNADMAASMAQARLVAEKIRASLSEPYHLLARHDGQATTSFEHRCSASIGVALFIDHEISQEDVLKRADWAMYKAKEAGRNLIHFYDAEA